ncbi:MAG: tRNA (adenosine(37)-N6)-dimethylallyltransferase MiaA [Flavobacteriaceae bacterium]|nr:tRNA (adenosine(37)-N6)-dimethylallyltransferase MiaA [Flavobacteriaceae bacterium]|tara:strand:- start:2311 stop:3213 length:903 start_codon:yes stop_codon:yes gene_type:complete
MKKTLITVSGPTASGKTKFSIKLAKELNCDIISSDSRQFYKEMSIGTAVPTKKQLKSVTHHCIQHKSIFDIYTIKDFHDEALSIIKDKLKINDYIIMVGGSGLYMDSVINGLDNFPDINHQVRRDLNLKFEKFGIEYLQKELKKIDPVYYNNVDKQNPRRLIRALEISISSKKPYSSFIGKKKTIHSFNLFHIGIDINRELLYQKINSRVDKMIENGFLEEVKTLINNKELNALNTLGYKELFLFLEKKVTFKQSIEEIKKNTRRFSKRQMTWLRKRKDIFWIDNKSDHKDIIKSYLDFK